MIIIWYNNFKSHPSFARPPVSAVRIILSQYNTFCGSDTRKNSASMKQTVRAKIKTGERYEAKQKRKSKSVHH